MKNFKCVSYLGNNIEQNVKNHVSQEDLINIFEESISLNNYVMNDTPILAVYTILVVHLY